ncbi:MAG: hypothetical protein FD149_1352 [Rhodospirillaceae bacterium]|nr:MAG: hypothetical protein FD149_1352 [Rhodospirillaceae bacterium]
MRSVAWRNRMPESTSTPQYTIRFRRHGPADSEIEVWQVPSPATPQLKEPLRVAGLRGRNLELVEHRVLRRLAAAGITVDLANAAGDGRSLDEESALRLGLLFRVLAPMRHRDRMRAVAEGVGAMGREEAAYWLGMAMHRKNPRRVLTALRILLTESQATSGLGQG